MTVGQDAFLEMVKADGVGEDGTVRLMSARIGGNLVLSRAVLANTSGPALSADRLIVDENAHLEVEMAEGVGQLGTVRMVGAHVGQLILSGAVLANTDGPALFADGLIVDRDASLDSVRAEGAGEPGAVRLGAAHIKRQLDLRRAVVVNNNGSALSADGLTVGQNAYLEKAEVQGTGENGALRLLDANVGGQLTLREAVLTNTDGPALLADGLTVGRDVYLEKAKVQGTGKDGALRLLGASVGGQLILNAAVLTNATGPALLADDLTVDEDASFEMVKAIGKEGVLRLIDARIGGSLIGNFPRVMAVSGPSDRMMVHGLTYRGLPRTGVDSWLKLVREATPRYSAQPYRQMAAAAAAQGHDAEVRKILIAQRRDQLQRAMPSWRNRAWGWITWLTLGYGYQPWRALIGLIGVAVLSAVLTVAFGVHGLYVKDRPEQQCTVADRVVLGVDSALPLITTPVAASCLTRPGPNQAAEAVTWTSIGAQAAGWAFATLFVAGFTGAVRKT